MWGSSTRRGETVARRMARQEKSERAGLFTDPHEEPVPPGRDSYGSADDDGQSQNDRYCQKPVSLLGLPLAVTKGCTILRVNSLCLHVAFVKGCTSAMREEQGDRHDNCQDSRSHFNLPYSKLRSGVKEGGLVLKRSLPDFNQCRRKRSGHSSPHCNSSCEIR